jgi:hypothetical protein
VVALENSKSSNGRVIVSPCVLEVFVYTGSIQQYQVPAGISHLGINAIGGGGGTSQVSSNPPGYAGGSGASITAVVPVTPGEILNILVGGQGQPSEFRMGGGGGGTFVYRTPDLAGLLVAAGGGASTAPFFSGNPDGSPSQNAFDGGGTSPGVAGSGGNGGSGSASTAGGSGGAGLLSDGGASADGGTGGTSIASGGAGGTGGVGADGGFGGGGAGGNTGGGAAGGFNGGGGGGSNGAGGGGSSYVEPLGTTISAGTETSSNDGMVMIFLPGGVFADGFESGDTTLWSTTVPAP